MAVKVISLRGIKKYLKKEECYKRSIANIRELNHSVNGRIDMENFVNSSHVNDGVKIALSIFITGLLAKCAVLNKNKKKLEPTEYSSKKADLEEKLATYNDFIAEFGQRRYCSCDEYKIVFPGDYGCRGNVDFEKASNIVVEHFKRQYECEFKACIEARNKAYQEAEEEKAQLISERRLRLAKNLGIVIGDKQESVKNVNEKDVENS